MSVTGTLQGTYMCWGLLCKLPLILAPVLKYLETPGEVFVLPAVVEDPGNLPYLAQHSGSLRSHAWRA